MERNEKVPNRREMMEILRQNTDPGRKMRGLAALLLENDSIIIAEMRVRLLGNKEVMRAQQQKIEALQDRLAEKEGQT